MKGIILLGGGDEVIESRARSRKLPVELAPDLQSVLMPWRKCLIVEPGTRVPWDLLPAAWHFLDRWDAAVPLWRYGVLAADVGGADERKITRSAIRDLRVLLHAVELLFVRNGEQGQGLLAAWQAEMAEGDEKRLAFLRAVYTIKPRLCVLPRNWLAEVQQWQAPRNGRSSRPASPLVKVEIAPGQYVKCYAGDEERVAAMFAAGSDDMPVVNSNSFKVVNDKTNAGKGPLVRVQIAPNRIVKMYEKDAIEQGYLQKKAEPPKENKGRPPQGNKGGDEQPPVEAEAQAEEQETDPGESAAADDLTSITGIGKATERLINAHGITTFEQLRSAEDLSFLNTQAQQAVEDWLNG